MERAAVIERLCRLTTKVACEHFDHMEAADCFCDQRNEPIVVGARAVLTPIGMGDYRFSEKILEFIESAVTAAIRSTRYES